MTKGAMRSMRRAISDVHHALVLFIMIVHSRVRKLRPWYHGGAHNWSRPTTSPKAVGSCGRTVMRCPPHVGGPRHQAAGGGAARARRSWCSAGLGGGRAQGTGLAPARSAAAVGGRKVRCSGEDVKDRGAENDDDVAGCAVRLAISLRKAEFWNMRCRSSCCPAMICDPTKLDARRHCRNEDEDKPQYSNGGTRGSS